ncbi:hypothetical protein GGF31_001711 [Allomyces arbusculus]|nr:hypothetical protein GGF31_001711 [Allomyces arbusculus]
MTRINVFRNLKSTLTVVTRSNSIRAKEMQTLPLNLRPPTFRPDHWTKVLSLTGFSTDEHADRALGKIKAYDLPIPRDHRAKGYDPVKGKILAVAKALDEVKARGARLPPLTAQWERLDLKDVVKDQQMLWPAEVTHQVIPTKTPAYVKRIDEAWGEKAMSPASQ